MSACIETIWKRDPKGYGLGYVKGVGNRRAHRWAWEQANGPIPADMFVCHHCDNPPCINVEHLFLGTPQDNMRDRDAKGRVASGDRSGSRTRRDRRPRGEANGRAKLTAGQIAHIHVRRTAGQSHRCIGVALGVSASHIGRILAGQRWRPFIDETAP